MTGTTLQSGAVRDMSGQRLYSPVVIGLYCGLASLPLGLILYGINVLRRGEVWMGRVLIALAVIVEVCMILSTFFGQDPFGGSLFLLFRREILQGAVRARWWPPLLWAVGANVLLGGALFFGD